MISYLSHRGGPLEAISGLSPQMISKQVWSCGTCRVPPWWSRRVLPHDAAHPGACRDETV